MSKLLPILLLVVVIYLNRSYAYFYDFIGSHQRAVSRTPENYLIPTKASNKPLEYTALGDSLTAGEGVSDFHFSYPYLVAQNLEEQRGEVTLNNLGILGATSKDVLDREVDKAISEKPDVVSLLIGINDIHNLVSTQTFEKNYVLIIAKIKNQTNAQIVLINIPYLGSPKTLLFPYNIILDLRTRQFNSVIKTLAQKNNLRYIDLYNGTKNKFGLDLSLYSEDGFHPSYKGYSLFGEIINADSGL